jgi:hypothetical protein
MLNLQKRLDLWEILTRNLDLIKLGLVFGTNNIK